MKRYELLEQLEDIDNLGVYGISYEEIARHFYAWLSDSTLKEALADYCIDYELFDYYCDEEDDDEDMED